MQLSRAAADKCLFASIPHDSTGNGMLIRGAKYFFPTLPGFCGGLLVLRMSRFGRIFGRIVMCLAGIRAFFDKNVRACVRACVRDTEWFS